MILQGATLVTDEWLVTGEISSFYEFFVLFTFILAIMFFKYSFFSIPRAPKVHQNGVLTKKFAELLRV